MKISGFIWGVGGVVALLLSAVFRLFPRVVELRDYPLTLYHWLLLAGFVSYMLYAEGYKGFHRNFSPRVALRADYLRKEGKPWMLLLAPLVCMGFVHATRKRMLVTWLLTTGLIALVVLVSHASQPWRGIIDAGVVAGLCAGVLSLLYHVAGTLTGRLAINMNADFPD